MTVDPKSDHTLNDDRPRSNRRRFLASTTGLGLTALGAAAIASCGGDERPTRAGDGTQPGNAASVPASPSQPASGDAGAAGLPSDSLAIPGGPATKPMKGVKYPPGYVGPRASIKGPCTKDGKPASLRIVTVQDPLVGEWDKNGFTKWYEKRTKVHIDWEVVAGGDDTMTKVNAMIASGDLPDAFMGVPFTASQIYTYGQQGIFMPLQGLIDEYCPETKQMYREYPDTEKLITAPDGNVYAWPYINDAYHEHYSNPVWIYRPWLEKLGLSMPETTEEFEKVLRAFKTGDPNGDGSSVIPLTGYKDAYMSDFFMGSFLYNPGNPWLLLDDGKVDFAADKPAWREGLKYQRHLVDEGLLAKEAFTQTTESLQKQGNRKQPYLGVVRGYYWAVFLTIDDNDPNARFRDYEELPTLKGPDGTRTAAWDYYSWLNTFVVPNSIVITTKCKHPAVAAMWADTQCELTNLLSAYNGVSADGKLGWRYATDDERGFTGKRALWTTKGTWPPGPGKYWDQRGVNYRSNDFRLGEVVDQHAPTFEYQFYLGTKKYYPYREPKEQQLPPTFFSEDQAARIADTSVSLTNLVTRMEAEFSVGKSDVNDDKVWGTYVDTIKRMGLEDYLQTWQDAHDARASG